MILLGVFLFFTFFFSFRGLFSSIYISTLIFYIEFRSICISDIYFCNFGRDIYLFIYALFAVQIRCVSTGVLDVQLHEKKIFFFVKLKFFVHFSSIQICWTKIKSKAKLSKKSWIVCNKYMYVHYFFLIRYNCMMMDNFKKIFLF